jgi:diguanylate cyclase (GGDEF)-like protein
MKSDDVPISGGWEAPAEADELLRPIAEALDGVGIAACVFDDDDLTLVWNRTFLRFFPEHARAIRVGEPYAVNLRRFYEARLDAQEMPAIERYIGEGLARHRAQTRPFVFAHRGAQLRVASVPLPGVGRIRIWRSEGEGTAALEAATSAPGSTRIDGTALLDHVPDGVMVSDADDRIVWVNESFVGIYGLRDRDSALGLSFEETYGIAWRGFDAGAHRTLFEQGMAVLTEQLRFAGAPFEVPLPHARWIRVIEQRSPDGRRFFAHVDITVLKRQQHELMLAEARARESEALLRQKSALLETTLERMEQGIMMVSADNVVLVCNQRLIELLELPPQLMASQPTFEQVTRYQMTEGEYLRAPQNLPDFVRGGGTLGQPHRYERERPDGRVIEVHSMPLEGGGVVRTYTDITTRRRSEERIRHLARHDGLTSLVNREYFLERLADAVTDFACTSERFAVQYIDIDEFKPVNDRFGHAAGDKVIALAAQRLRDVTGGQGLVGRMGGDEFVILQYGVTHPDIALELARRVLDAVLQPMCIETHSIRLAASIGIVIHTDVDDDADTLIRRADKAMYEAKNERRGSVRLFEALP